MAKEQQPVPRLFYSVTEFARACGLSRQTVYNQINAGNIHVRCVGERKLIPVDVARKWAENLPDSSAA